MNDIFRIWQTQIDPITGYMAKSKANVRIPMGIPTPGKCNCGRRIRDLAATVCVKCYLREYQKRRAK